LYNGKTENELAAFWSRNSMRYQIALQSCENDGLGCKWSWNTGLVCSQFIKYSGFPLSIRLRLSLAYNNQKYLVSLLTTI